jgi:hypothetical protein
VKPATSKVTMKQPNCKRLLGTALNVAVLIAYKVERTSARVTTGGFLNICLTITLLVIFMVSMYIFLNEKQ